jgi:hypothetical protein
MESTPENEAAVQKEMDKFWDVVAEPWTAKKYPLYAEWLNANRKPLGKIREATRRPKYYSPLIAAGERPHLVNCLATVDLGSRNCARFLRQDAMLAIGEGRIEDAENDLLACHRLGRLVCQGPLFIDFLTGVAIDGTACWGDRTLAQSGRLSAAQALSYRKKLLELPPLPKTSDKFDLGERVWLLDNIPLIARDGPGSVKDLLTVIPGKKPSERLLSQFSSISTTDFDWDTVMRTSNSWFDRMVAAGRKPTRAERVQAWQKIDDELRHITQENKSDADIEKALSNGQPARAVLAKKMGDILISSLAAPLKGGCGAEIRREVDNDLSQFVLALSAYRSDRGSYPERLTALTPEYFPDFPEDCYTASDYIYRRDGNAYLLYSVGPNGKDDGGADREKDPENDDIAIRSPQESK